MDVLLTLWTAGTIIKLIPPTNLPVALTVRVDRVVLVVTFMISMLAAMVFGILPALRSSNLTPVAVLKEESASASGGLRRARLASGLVVAQLSLSLLLLICAGLFIRSFQRAQRFDPGFNPGHVLLSSYNLFTAGYSQADAVEFNRQLQPRLQELPGIESVAFADWVPLGLSYDAADIAPEGYVGRLHEKIPVASFVISPDYFRTMQIPLVAGREFTPLDTDKAEPVVVVNRELVERYWPHQNAIGKRIRVGLRQTRVIGVVANVNYVMLNEAPQPAVYEAELQHYFPYMTVHARVAGDPMAFAAAVEKTIHELDPDLPVFEVRTLQSQIELASVTQRIAGTFVGTFGLLALVLAAVGIYGVIAYTTRQRTREIGIRMALGAQRVQVLRLVLNQGLRLTFIGLAFGLVLSLALTRFLASLLFGVAATDALTFAGVAVLLCLVALAACFLPARRATRVDPMVVLRYE
jgi:predicted permease